MQVVPIEAWSWSQAGSQTQAGTSHVLLTMETHHLYVAGSEMASESRPDVIYT